MSVEKELEVRAARYRRMPEDVCQECESVRVLRHTPERVELQIRNPKHFMQASMTSAEARELAARLQSLADEADRQAA